MRSILVIILVSLMSFGYNAQAQPSQRFVVAPDVEVQYFNGELRFCERANLRGITCGFEQKLFGKSRFAARDWWSPGTYVQARTSLNEFTLWNVSPTPDGRGVIITFSD